MVREKIPSRNGEMSQRLNRDAGVRGHMGLYARERGTGRSLAHRASSRFEAKQ